MGSGSRRSDQEIGDKKNTGTRMTRVGQMNTDCFFYEKNGILIPKH